jgi:hypothetical protein
MRRIAIALLASAAAAACTPEIVSGSYLCGPNATCPGDQICNGPDNICVSSAALPFECDPEIETEPDDASEQAFDLGSFDCMSLATVLDSCMLEGDTGDWVRLTTPTACDSLSVDVRVTFPTAFEELGLALWDLDANEHVADDEPCTFMGEGGDELRCLKADVLPGTHYGVQVAPTGEGACDGTCAYNRYTLRMQLSSTR